MKVLASIQVYKYCDVLLPHWLKQAEEETVVAVAVVMAVVMAVVVTVVVAVGAILRRRWRVVQAAGITYLIETPN